MTQPGKPPEWLKEWATVAAKLGGAVLAFSQALKTAIELFG